jgi:hypothetical protein
MGWLHNFGMFAGIAVWVGVSAILFAQGATCGDWKYILAGCFGGVSFLATMATIMAH